MKEMKRDETRRGYTFILGITVLALLALASIAGAEPFAYITGPYSNSVSVIDTATNKVTATIDVGNYPTAIAASSDGTNIYVTNTWDNTTSVINTTTNTVTATIDVGDFPHGVAVTPDGTRVYVTNFNDDTVSVIDTATSTVISTVPVEDIPCGVAVSPDGSKVYVASGHYNACISVIDTASNTVTAKVNIFEPNGFDKIAVTPDGAKLYVTPFSPDNQVSIIDMSTNTLTAWVKVGRWPNGVTVTPDGTKVYVVNSDSNNVSIIDTATNTVTSTVKVGFEPLEVAVTPDGTKAYVTNYYGNNISIIDTATNTVTSTVKVRQPNGIVITTPKLPKLILPIANFSTNISEGHAPLTVPFTDLSTNATSVTWDFGDGNNSEERNPVHEYSDPGTYTVNLTASNENGTDLKSATITVVDKSVLPVADFSASVTSGKTPLNVAFTDTSTGLPTSWFWNFGDGSKSFLQNPIHKYSKVGVYTVNLTVKNAAGRNTVTKTEYIKVVAKPVAAFSASPTSGKAPLNVKFNDTSTGSPTSWFWNFGDGSKSFLQNPIHKYSKAGIYTVNLTVKNAVGRNMVTKTEYIKVITKPVANFTGSVTSGNTPLKVTFNDTSTGTPAAWIWNFGDGSKSFFQNPIHKYSNAGIYTVNLTVKNAAGRNTVTKTEYIQVI